MSALKLAKGITGDWSKISVADTENDSSLYYADLGPWNHIPFPPPHHPRRFSEVIEYAISKGTECLVIDSISHEWEGRGGCLELLEEVQKAQRTANSYTAWKTVTPLHNKFIEAMLQAPIHIIATMRAKQDYVLEQNDKGKAVPKKVGLKGIQP